MRLFADIIEPHKNINCLKSVFIYINPDSMILKYVSVTEFPIVQVSFAGVCAGDQHSQQFRVASRGRRLASNIHFLACDISVQVSCLSRDPGGGQGSVVPDGWQVVTV